MEALAMIAMLLGIVAIGACVVLVWGRLFRKVCPDCGRRSLAFDGIDVGAKPRVFRCYACVRCVKAFATADGRTFVAKDAWIAGQRDAAPTATVERS